MKFRKVVMITLYAKQKKDTEVQNRLLDSVGEGEGGMFRDNSTEMYIIYSETDCQLRLDA